VIKQRQAAKKKRRAPQLYEAGYGDLKENLVKAARDAPATP